MVRLGTVTDARVFPPEVTLRDDGDATRVVAAAANHLQLLPEGKTVAALVGALVTRGMAQAGYRVVGSSDAATETAPTVDVRIERFWGSFHEDIWWWLGFQIEVRLVGGVAHLDHGDVLASTATRSVYHPPAAQLFSGPRASAWKVVLDEACAAFVGQVERRFQRR